MPIAPGIFPVTAFAGAINTVAQGAGAGTALDCRLGNIHIVTVSGNMTTATTLTNPIQTGQGIAVEYVQDATGGRTILLPTVTWKGISPSPPTAANARLNVTLFWDGTNWREVSRSYSTSVDNPVVVRKTADQTAALITLADDTHLQVPVAANGEYIIEVCLFVTSAATTTGAAVALNGPASPTAITYTAQGQMTQGAAGAASTVFMGGSTAYNTILLGASVPSTTVPAQITMQGYLVNGANAGTLVVRLAAELAAVITYRRGSWMRVTRVA